jgi:hypothetical protein
MKKFFAFAFLAVFIVVGVAFPAAARANFLSQGLVGLPAELSLLIVTLLTAGVTWLLLQLSTWLKIDLTGQAQAIVAIVAPILITLIENLLGTIPSIYDNIVLTIFHLIVLLVGSLGTYLIVQRAKAREMNSLLMRHPNG